MKKSTAIILAGGGVLLLFALFSGGEAQAQAQTPSGDGSGSGGGEWYYNEYGELVQAQAPVQASSQQYQPAYDEYGYPTQQPAQQPVQQPAQQYANPKQQQLIAAADTLTSQNAKAGSCFDFVQLIFNQAGYGNISSQLDFPWIGNQYAGTYRSRTIQPKPFMDDFELNTLQPGDWLYINNGNDTDSKGNHSVLFYGWVDAGNRLAKTAEQRTLTQGGIQFQRDLRTQKVAHVMRVKP